MKKLILLSLLVSNVFSGIEYKPNYLIKQNLSGFNINVSAWNWHPNNKDWRELDPTEKWGNLSYYSKNNYTFDVYYAIRDNFDNVKRIDATYNTVPMDIFINRNGISYHNKRKFSVFSSFSFDYNFINYFSINYLIGERYRFSSNKFDLINCFTFSFIPDKNILEYFFSYWMVNKPSDDHIWLGIGINLFLDKKVLKNDD